MEQLLSGVVKEHGRLDGVVNCVGNYLTKPTHTTTLEEFKQVLDSNLVSSFNILKSSVNAMMASGKGGAIVFLTSAGGCW